MDLFGDMAAILNSVVLNNYYGMVRGRGGEKEMEVRGRGGEGRGERERGRRVEGEEGEEGERGEGKREKG